MLTSRNGSARYLKSTLESGTNYVSSVQAGLNIVVDARARTERATSDGAQENTRASPA